MKDEDNPINVLEKLIFQFKKIKIVSMPKTQRGEKLSLPNTHEDAYSIRLMKI